MDSHRIHGMGLASGMNCGVEKVRKQATDKTVKLDPNQVLVGVPETRIFD